MESNIRIRFSNERWDFVYSNKNNNKFTLKYQKRNGIDAVAKQLVYKMLSIDNNV